MTNEIPTDFHTLGGYISEFCCAYERQEELGRADDIGGWQFSHALAEWLLRGRPEPLDEWIVERCNYVPAGTH